MEVWECDGYHLLILTKLNPELFTLILFFFFFTQCAYLPALSAVFMGNLVLQIVFSCAHFTNITDRQNGFGCIF